MMDGKVITPKDSSGAYKCSKCGNREIHMQGKPKAPCSNCESDSHWVLIRQSGT